MKMNFHFVLNLAAAALLLWNPTLVGACSCMRPITLFNSLRDESLTAVKIWIRNEIFPNGALDNASNNGFRYFRYFRAKVQRAYRGCNLQGQPDILVKTGRDSAACGIDINPRTEYLMFGFIQREAVPGYNGPRRVLSVGLCQYQIPFSQLTRTQRNDLTRRRYQDNCPPELCDDANECGPVPPVAPPILCPDGSSTFYDIQCIDVGSRCQWDVKSSSCPACSEDADCSFPSYCSQGLCRTKGTCDSIADCWNPSSTMVADDASTTELPCLGEKRECVASVCKSTCCTNIFNCFVDPCDNVQESYYQCVSDYCGGCNAYAFDRAGNLVN